MNADDLTTEQAQKIRDAISPTLGYLSRLRERMDRTGFVAGDPLYQLVDQAYDRLHHLSVELHYRSCERGKCGRERVAGCSPIINPVHDEPD